MKFDRKNALKKLTSINVPVLVPEGEIPDCKSFRIFTEECGYLVEFDEPPVTGLYEISDDEIEAYQQIIEDEGADGFFETGDVAAEMFQADCEPDIPYYRYQLIDIDEEPVFSENLDEFAERLIEDIIGNEDCQMWDNMSNEDLEEWLRWYDLG